MSNATLPRKALRGGSQATDQRIWRALARFAKPAARPLPGCWRANRASAKRWTHRF